MIRCTFSLPSIHHHRCFFPNPSPLLRLSSSANFAIKPRLIRRINNNKSNNESRDGKQQQKFDGPSSIYVDKAGVVEDMDGYLNSLSLEYDSVWDTKPSWCQPWTIMLTGITVVACSWLPLHSVIITAGATFVISAWWYIFLYSYPKAYTEMIEERRKKVAGGMEDTFGNKPIS